MRVAARTSLAVSSRAAHQAELLRGGETCFLAVGDVYRRDSVDATHYPVFHQMEGVRIFAPSDWEASGLGAAEFAERDLKVVLEGLARYLFGDEIQIKWGALVCSKMHRRMWLHAAR